MATVLIPVFGQFDTVRECISRVVKYTHTSHRILVIDDHTPESEGSLHELISAEPYADRVELIRTEANLGFPSVVNLGFQLAGIDHVAIVNSDAFVSHDWLERMLNEMARSDLVATVTAMTNNGSVAAVKIDRESLPAETFCELDHINLKLGEMPRLPQIVLPVGVGHCMLISRRVITVVGDFSVEFNPGYGEEVDFCLRAISQGFINVLASDTFVWHYGGSSFGATASTLRHDHEALIRQKYPVFPDYVDSTKNRFPMIETAFARVLLLRRPIRVLFDWPNILSIKTGSALAASELVRTLVSALGAESVTLLARTPELESLALDFPDVKVLNVKGAGNHVRELGRFDVLLRPIQMGQRSELKLFWTLARRVAMVQLDFIAYDNLFYHENANSHNEYQDTNVVASSIMDSVLYISEHTRQESRRTIGRADRTCDGVINLGTDHLPILESWVQPEKRHRRILVLGTAYASKNRQYVVRMVQVLDQLGFPPIHIDMVGANPPRGGTLELDRILTEELEGESTFSFTQWSSKRLVADYLEHAAVVLYPTLSEGFGFIPFEAARSGAAPLFGPFTSLGELLPKAPYFLSFENVRQDASVLETLLSDERAREEQRNYVLEQGARLNWKSVGANLVPLLELAANLPPAVPPAVREAFLAQRSRQSFSARFRRLRNSGIGNKVFRPGSPHTRVLKVVLVRLNFPLIP